MLTKVHMSKLHFFSSSHVWMLELDHKEDWAPKNWYFWTVVLEKTLGVFGVPCTARTGAETPILWPPDVKSWVIGKDPDAGKDWRQEEKGTTEDEMVRWHNWLNGLGFGWSLGLGDGQGGLVCCGSWGHKESDTTERLNWTELNWTDWHHWWRKKWRPTPVFLPGESHGQRSLVGYSP